jgi:predicted GH43/DUF377 family glycosyl hydrolase
MEKKLIIRKEHIKPSRPDFEVIGAFNPGSIVFENEIILLVRVAERPIQNDDENYLVPIFDSENNKIFIKKIKKNSPNYNFSDKRVITNRTQNYLTSISHFRVARSKDGIHFEISETPSVFPENKYESFGIEDPRIVFIDGIFYITYSAISEYGINGCIMTTKDFIHFERQGIAFTSDNKDVVLFPEKINDKYYALHRPSTSEYGRLDIWISKSKDLKHWGDHNVLLTRRENMFDNHRLGGSAVPFLTEHGWIEIYHSGNQDNEYSLAAVLLDTKDPSKVIKRSSVPLLSPEEVYETNGFFGKVVFCCGVIVDCEIVHVYYGVSDESVAYAKMSLNEIYNNLGLTQGV